MPAGSAFNHVPEEGPLRASGGRFLSFLSGGPWPSLVLIHLELDLWLIPREGALGFKLRSADLRLHPSLQPRHWFALEQPHPGR